MRKFLSTTFIIAITSISLAAFQVNSYNLEVGSSYHIEVDQSQEISQIIMGAPNTITTENASLELLEVENINAVGDYTLRLTVLSQKTVVASPMMSMVEDSENPDMGSGLYVALKNSSYQFEMTKAGEIKNIMGLDEVKASLNEKLSGNPQSAAQIEALFDEDLIRSTLELRFSFFPNAGDTEWSENKTMTMNNMPIEMATNYAYDNDFTISADSDITIDATTVQMGTNVELDLTGTQNATYTLNENTGFPTNFDSVNDITGNASAAGMQIPMTIRTDTKTTFTKQ